MRETALHQEARGNDEEIKKAIAKIVKPEELTELPPRIGPVRKVFLVVPPGMMEESYGRLSGAAGELPMLGLAYIAASLRHQGHHVKLIDYEVSHLGWDQFEKDLRDFNPDVVGVTTYITNMKRCAETARRSKLFNPKIRTVFGGPQVSVFPEEGLTSPDVDMIVLSEGEVVIRNVMNRLYNDEELKKTPGIWFRTKTGEIVKNKREILVADLDIFPEPALDLYQMENYYPPAHIRGKKVAHLLTSRGCPFACTFCETKLTFGRSFRYHSTQRVLQDLEKLIQQGYDSFQFYDDIFTVNKQRVIELCQGIIDKGWKIQWMCFTRTNCLSDDMLAIMKKAGCYLITFGAESGNDDLLERIKKNLTVKKNYEGIQMAKKHGILTLSSFMLGLPGETAEHTEKTIQFAINSGLDYAVFPITEPYPGTEMWVDAQKYGDFDTSGKYKNNLLSENNAVWIPHGRTREELHEFAQRAMLKFYLRPRILWQGVKNFFHLPFSRASRYFLAGAKFVLDSAKPGTRF